ncbi:hypothetical protein ACP70R_037700 [Stipagrostis hirtigluma subsp. patula]
MYSNFKEQAIEYVKQAVQEDNAGNYCKAFPLYMNALEYFKTHLRYEKNPKVKEAIVAKFEEYLRRAQEIRALLEECGAAPSANTTRKDGDDSKLSKQLEHRAKEAFFDDDFALAAALFTQAIAAAAPTAALHADRAQVYIKMGDFAGAAADAARAAKLDPAMPRAHLRVALACVKLGQYDVARTAVEAGAALAPGDARFAQLREEIGVKQEKEEKLDGDAATNNFFQD